MTNLLTTTAVLGALGVGAGGDPGQIVGVTGNHIGSPNTASLTYSNAPLGSAVSGRIIYLVCTYFDGASSDQNPSSVTVGGNAATLLAGVHKPSDNTCGISIWAYQDDGALGATANVVVTHPTQRNSFGVTVLEASAGDGNVVDSVGDADMTASVVGDTLTTTAAKCLIYVCNNQNGSEQTAPSPFDSGEYSYDENSTEWTLIAWDNEPDGSPVSVDIPASGMGLRSAYLAVALD